MKAIRAVGLCLVFVVVGAFAGGFLGVTLWGATVQTPDLARMHAPDLLAYERQLVGRRESDIAHVFVGTISGAVFGGLMFLLLRNLRSLPRQSADSSANLPARSVPSH
jgi:hypothetical protein